jgi:DivIVA domain-containing protein
METGGDAWHDLGVVLVVEILVVAAIVFVVAALAVGWFDRMAPAPPDGPPSGLPPGGAVGAREVAGMRLSMALRGYRMAEVDDVLARLAEELAWRDDELARRDEELVRLAAFAQVDVAVATAEPVNVPDAERADPHASAAPVTGAPGAGPVTDWSRVD